MEIKDIAKKLGCTRQNVEAIIEKVMIQLRRPDRIAIILGEKVWQEEYYREILVDAVPLYIMKNRKHI